MENCDDHAHASNDDDNRYIIYTDIAPTDPLMPNDTDNDENYELYDR